MTRDDLLTLSQRLREYNHNPHHINPVSDAFHKLITESAEALSQLAAIQGGMGEEPLVVATAILGGLFHGGSGPELGEIDFEPDMKALERIQYELVNSSDDVSLDLMTVAQHKRIVAALSTQQSAPELGDGWIPVSERLPAVAQEVIVDSEFDGVTAGFLDSYGEWYSPNSDYKLTRVVAWQPLPAAPSLKVPFI